MRHSISKPSGASLCFQDIHRYMRSETKASEASQSFVRSIFAQCIQHIELRDELFCQVVRLLTDNPSDEMRFRLWPLLCLASISFSPSTALRKVVLPFHCINE